MRKRKLLSLLVLLIAVVSGAWATPNSIVINGTPQVGDKSISLTYYFDPANVPGLEPYVPTLKVKCAADNKWDETLLDFFNVSSGTTNISLENLGEFEAGKTYEVCFAYNNGNWVDEVFQSFVPAAPATTYTVTLKEDAELAYWTVSVDGGSSYVSLPQDVAEGTTVTAAYAGDLKVKSFTAAKKAGDNITVYFTDAQFFRDVNVYYWPNGGNWPGKAMTRVETNEYNQTVYKAEIPANVDGIIFNGNGRQTVDITESIVDGASWYSIEGTDDAGHNKVVYIPDIEVTSTDGIHWSFDMPDYDVELEMEYYPLATLTTTPAATTGDIFENTTTALITAGASEEGTVYYAVSTSDATAPTDGWSTDVPTAEGRSTATYYIWYKVVGDDTHSNSVPQYIAVTIAAIPTYAVTIDDANVDAANWEADPTEQQAGEKVKLTYKGKKKIKSITIEAAPILVTSITLNKTSTTISTGETETLSVTAVAPENATDKTYTWKSSDETKATVDQNGVVTAKAAGTVTIYAEANDGSGVKGECAVTVQAVLQSETITFSGGFSGTYFQVTGTEEESGILNVDKYNTMVISAKTGKTIVKVVFSYGDERDNKDTLSFSSGNFDGYATVNNVNATSLTVSSSNIPGIDFSGVTVYYYE